MVGISVHMVNVQNIKPEQNCTCVFLGCTPLTLAFSLLITFANSLDPDQDRQNVGPDLDPNCLTLSVPERIVSLIC